MEITRQPEHIEMWSALAWIETDFCWCSAISVDTEMDAICVYISNMSRSNENMDEFHWKARQKIMEARK